MCARRSRTASISLPVKARPAAAGGGIVQGSATSLASAHHGGDGILIGGPALPPHLGVSGRRYRHPASAAGRLNPHGEPCHGARTMWSKALFPWVFSILDRIYVFMPLEAGRALLQPHRGGLYRHPGSYNPHAPEAVVEAVRPSFVPPGSAVFDWRRQNQSFWTACRWSAWPCA